MSNYTSYKTINSLEEISFIAGTTYEMTFNVYDENGVPVNIVLYSCTWKMSRYGQPSVNVITKTGTVSTYSFTVTLDPSDTENLSGKFVHQATIVDTDGKVYRPAQGTILIIPEVS